MKKTLVIIAALAAFYAAFADDPAIAKLQEHQRRTVEADAKISTLKKATDALGRIPKGEDKEAIRAGLKLALSLLEEQRDAMERDMIKDGNQLKGGKTAAAPVPPVVEAMIRLDAAKRYPNDYSMQDSVVTGQIDAFQKLSRYKGAGIAGVPPTVLKPIISDAESRWKTDYVMVVSVIDNQVESYARVK